MDDGNRAMGLVHLLRALTVELDRFGGEFAALHGLHPTDLRALIELLDADRAGTAATPGLLGGRLGLNSAGTTALVDRLERLGLIRRGRDTADRRRVLLAVDERAVELGRSFFGPVIGELVTAMAGFDPAELDTARRFLGAMGEAVARARGADGAAGAPGSD
ncbi:MarR family winged helix-turn-helix transcriptional regulator [Kitasatospora sp. MBT63]|uniref:MarR family winged helix-turn-helix transcriptional regulator n=1 Tax=Kitasatospora sp. MBT63 TaxID=1444768 RepID=UPI00053AA018|nr:MarR family transcriptional regulator [Kitasatospora sp. MBT63]